MNAFWLLSASALLAASPAPHQFTSGTAAVYIDVAVSKGDRPLEGLAPADFEVKDDGVRQQVQIVSRDERSVHAVLVLDLSDSLSPEEKQQLRDAAAGFLGKLAPRDQATLVTFTHEMQLISGPSDPASVRATLGDLDAMGSTALFDAVFAGISVASMAPGRPFVVLFSDGIDVCSWVRAERVRKAAKQADATVYHVNPKLAGAGDRKPKLTYVSPNTIAYTPSSILAEIVHETGGRTWSGQFGRVLEDSFARILSEVQSRYLLMYEPEGPQRPGWHTLDVKLRHRSGKVRARPGYFAATP